MIAALMAIDQIMTGSMFMCSVYHAGLPGTLSTENANPETGGVACGDTGLWVQALTSYGCADRPWGQAMT